MARTLTVSYSYHVDLQSEECVNESLNIQTFDEAAKIIDQYPWQFESEYFEVHGEAQGINISSGDSRDIEIVISADDENHATVLLDIVADAGFLGLFGGKKVSKSFTMLPFEQVKQILRDVLALSLEELYQKYSDKKSIVQ